MQIGIIDGAEVAPVMVRDEGGAWRPETSGVPSALSLFSSKPPIRPFWRQSRRGFECFPDTRASLTSVLSSNDNLQPEGFYSRLFLLDTMDENSLFVAEIDDELFYVTLDLPGTSEALHTACAELQIEIEVLPYRQGFCAEFDGA